MVRISWTNYVRNLEVNKESRRRGIAYLKINKKKRHAEWIGHIFHTNCLLQQVIERKIEGRIYMMGRRGRRHKQL